MPHCSPRTIICRRGLRCRPLMGHYICLHTCCIYFEALGIKYQSCRAGPGKTVLGVLQLLHSKTCLHTRTPAVAVCSRKLLESPRRWKDKEILTTFSRDSLDSRDLRLCNDPSAISDCSGLKLLGWSWPTFD